MEHGTLHKQTFYFIFIGDRGKKIYTLYNNLKSITQICKILIGTLYITYFSNISSIVASLKAESEDRQTQKTGSGQIYKYEVKVFHLRLCDYQVPELYVNINH